MAFCIKEKHFIDTGFTAVENRFFLNFMPDAPNRCTQTYLLGLTLSNSDGDDNCIETIANKLNISAEEVMDAFRYWEELGLVTVLDSVPPQVLYHGADSNSTLKKIKPSKYAKFSKQIQSVIEGRMLTVNEYNEYYTFLEETTFSPDALVYVAKYCAEMKGNNIGYQYILTVARNQLAKGATTLATVTENLSSQQKYDDDLKLVFKAMQSNRGIDYSDRANYEKWTKDFGFAPETIIAVAKSCKTGGMGRLDAKLSEYYKKGALSDKEISDYEEEKNRINDLARTVTKTIGVYYQNLESVTDEYIVPWLRRGFDEETLVAIARYCFKSGIRTLNGVASIIDKLYKNGIVNLAALDGYFAMLADTDAKIQSVLVKCGLDRRTTANDRLLYKTWTESWNMPEELILLAAEMSVGTGSPLAYVNRVLSDWKQRGIVSAEQAKRSKAASASAAATATYVGGTAIERRHYTDEEINSWFSALEEDDK